jgi:hypothetical protein
MSSSAPKPRQGYTWEASITNVSHNKEEMIKKKKNISMFFLVFNVSIVSIMLGIEIELFSYHSTTTTTEPTIYLQIYRYIKMHIFYIKVLLRATILHIKILTYIKIFLLEIPPKLRPLVSLRCSLQNLHCVGFEGVDLVPRRIDNS